MMAFILDLETAYSYNRNELVDWFNYYLCDVISHRHLVGLLLTHKGKKKRDICRAKILLD